MPRAVWAALFAISSLWAQDERVVRLVEEIESLAVAEPPILGLDTQLRLGRTLAPKRPELARSVLRAAQARASGLAEPRTRSAYLRGVAAELSSLDPTGARALCLSIPRGIADFEGADTLSGCLADLMGAPDAEEKEIFLLAMSAAAFVNGAFPSALGRAREPDRGEMYAAAVNALPAEPSAAEFTAYLDLLEKAAAQEPAMLRSGMERAWRTLRDAPPPDEKSFRKRKLNFGPRSVELRNSRDALWLRLSAMMRRHAPELWSAREEDARRWRRVLDGVGDDQFRKAWREPEYFGREEKKREETEADLDISGLSYDEVIAAARRAKDPSVRAGALLELSDRENEPEARRAFAAQEALEACARMPLGEDRLIGLSMSTRRLWIFGLKEQAGRAAALLQDSFENLCRCDNAACDSLEGRHNCPEMVQNFAEYLYEEQLPPAGLGLSHRSLRARMLMFDLFEALYGRRKKTGFLNKDP
jgi:hypothetical protein